MEQTRLDWRLRRHRRRGVPTVALVLGLVLFGAVTANLFVWPDLPPPPPRVDAIIELGGPGQRDGVAVALAQAHRAPVLVQSTVAADAVSDRCLPPIPAVTILCFHPEPNTTQGEAERIGQLAEQRHWRSIILVTSPDHAWRARLEVNRCFGGEVYVSTTRLPAHMWVQQIAYQWAATTNALVFSRTC
jgi:uncharacterized SAM-binding protein YcdF (DUF218 family)